MSQGPRTIDTLLAERRTFAPNEEFLSRARVTGQGLFEAAGAGSEAFRSERARKHVSWHKPFDTVLEWDIPFAKWFVTGQLNASDNCLARHVVAKSDRETGQAISAFVTLRTAYEESTEPIAELRDHVAKLVGPIAQPKWIAFTPDLPKTRSGKIMRRLLRDIAENRALGDTTTLADSSIVADLQRRATEEEAKEQ
ncbi:MAG: AMP-binding enzyme [Candidatus Dormibacteria bacterium]